MKRTLCSAFSLLTTLLLPVPLIAFPLVATLTATQPATADSNHQDTVQDAAKVFGEMMQNEKTRIPVSLLRRSQAIAIIPSVTQAGFFVGGRHGTGVLMTHYPDGSWSNPVFVNVTGGSFGLQVGVKSTDMVLVFPNRSALSEVLKGNSLELGGNVTGTAGSSEGVAIETLDDRSGKEKIFAYSRSTGLFGGAAFEGAKLSLDSDKNREFYGQSLSSSQILDNPSVPAPQVVNTLKSTLYRAGS